MNGVGKTTIKSNNYSVHSHLLFNEVRPAKDHDSQDFTGSWSKQTRESNPGGTDQVNREGNNDIHFDR